MAKMLWKVSETFCESAWSDSGRSNRQKVRFARNTGVIQKFAFSLIAIDPMTSEDFRNFSSRLSVARSWTPATRNRVKVAVSKAYKLAWTTRRVHP
jgi:hypothetical protein